MLLLESMAKLFNSVREAASQKRAHVDVLEKLRELEEGMKGSFLAEKSLNSSGQNIDLIDIMMVATLGAYRAQEEFLGVKILDPEKYPLIFNRVTSIIQLPVVKEITPPHDELVSFLQLFRDQAMTFPTN